MKKYRITFNGREAGALGVRSNFTKEVEAPDEQAARLKLYDTHEHITVATVAEITPHQIPGHPGITVTVYGPKVAHALCEKMAQGYFVAVDGKPTARAELAGDQREAVAAFLRENFPEHATI